MRISTARMRQVQQAREGRAGATANHRAVQSMRLSSYTALQGGRAKWGERPLSAPHAVAPIRSSVINDQTPAVVDSSAHPSALLTPSTLSASSTLSVATSTTSGASVQNEPSEAQGQAHTGGEEVYKFQDKYRLGRKLGQGTFATVYAATRLKNHEVLAVKVFQRSSLDPYEAAAILNEFKILQMVNQHPHIVKVYDFFEQIDSFQIVMESVAGGELIDRIQKKTFYSEREAKDVMTMLFSAVKYCHDRNIVHR